MRWLRAAVIALAIALGLFWRDDDEVDEKNGTGSMLEVNSTIVEFDTGSAAEIVTLNSQKEATSHGVDFDAGNAADIATLNSQKAVTRHGVDSDTGNAVGSTAIISKQKVTDQLVDLEANGAAESAMGSNQGVMSDATDFDASTAATCPVNEHDDGSNSKVMQAMRNMVDSRYNKEVNDGKNFSHDDQVVDFKTKKFSRLIQLCSNLQSLKNLKDVVKQHVKQCVVVVLHPENKQARIDCNLIRTANGGADLADNIQGMVTDFLKVYGAKEADIEQFVDEGLELNKRKSD